MTQHQPSFDKMPPQGFKNVEFIAEPAVGQQVLVRGQIPDDDHFSAEAIRLTRKATRGIPFTEPVWSDVVSTMVMFRDKEVSFGPFGGRLREMRDATKPPAEAIMSIQAITQLASRNLGAELVTPTRYIVYHPKTDKIGSYEFDTLAEGHDSQNLEEAAVLLDMTGESMAGDKERAFLYGTLKFAAGEHIG